MTSLLKTVFNYHPMTNFLTNGQLDWNWRNHSQKNERLKANNLGAEIPICDFFFVFKYVTHNFRAFLSVLFFTRSEGLEVSSVWPVPSI